MYSLTFAHVYNKMIIGGRLPPKTALLLAGFKTSKDRLSDQFIEYDTAYHDKYGQLQHYEIPDGDLIILLLSSDDLLWTTVRRYSKPKEDLYADSIGETFEIIIQEEQ